jgi:hypothetical protein
MAPRKPKTYSEIFSIRFDNGLLALLNVRVKQLVKYAKDTGASTAEVHLLTPANVVRSLVRIGMVAENADVVDDVLANGLKRGPKTKQ